MNEKIKSRKNTQKIEVKIESPKMIVEEHEGNYKWSLKSILKHLGKFFLHSILFMIMYTVFTQGYTQIYLLLNYERLKIPITYPSLSVDLKYTVFMISKNRNQYLKTMESYVSKINPFEGEFHLNDIGSTQPLSLPPKYQNETRVRLFRKEEPQSTPFSFWRSLSFSLTHLQTEKVFYFDNCNTLPSHFKFSNHIPPTSKQSEYFPNTQRFYTGNFGITRSMLINFLLDLPLHIIDNPLSFFGSDQVLIWYFDLHRGTTVIHSTHDNESAQIEYSFKHLIVMRFWLWLNYYGRKISNHGLGCMNDIWCNDKKIICIYDGLLRKFLKLPGIYHIADSILRFKLFFYPVFFCSNVFGSWFLGGIFMLLTVVMFFGSTGTVVEYLFRRRKKKVGGWKRSNV